MRRDLAQVVAASASLASGSPWPSTKHAEVGRYDRPDEFVRLKEQALAMGFGHVEAGPLVRSSYHADEQIPAARKSLLAG